MLFRLGICQMSAHVVRINNSLSLLRNCNLVYHLWNNWIHFKCALATGLFTRESPIISLVAGPWQIKWAFVIDFVCALVLVAAHRESSGSIRVQFQSFIAIGWNPSTRSSSCWSINIAARFRVRVQTPRCISFSTFDFVALRLYRIARNADGNVYNCLSQKIWNCHREFPSKLSYPVEGEERTLCSAFCSCARAPIVKCQRLKKKRW